MNRDLDGLTTGPGVELTDDGGIIISWDRNDDEVSIVMPDDRSIVYFVAMKYSNRERHAGVVTKWSAVPKMLEWMEAGAPFPVDGVVEGTDR